MAFNIDLSGILRPNQQSPKYSTSYPNGSRPFGFQLVGVVAHGATLSITDGYSRLGTRANVKPLYVNLGDGKVGSSLGRDTTDYFSTDSVYQTAIKSGQLVGAVSRDFKAGSTTISIWGEMSFDPNKPLISYVKRYYNFDTHSPDCWSPSNNISINLKRNRLFTEFPINNTTDVYFSGGSSTTDNPSVYMMSENNISTGDFTNLGGGWDSNPNEPFKWVAEEFIFRNSSAGNKKDGSWKYYRDNQWINSSKYLMSTKQRYYSINSVAAGATYFLTIGGVTKSYVPSSASAAEISGGLVSAINADATLPVTATTNSNYMIWLTEKAGQTYPVVTCSTNFTLILNEAGCQKARLDQISNGCGRNMTACEILVGYHIEDDEYPGVYVGNAPTLAACTVTLEKLPQTAWTPGQIDFKFFDTGTVSPANAYFYIRTGESTWLNTLGIH